MLKSLGSPQNFTIYIMQKFVKIISACFPIREENIDTDQIVPARFLKMTTREGWGKYLFHDWRFDKNGKKKKNSLFDEFKYRGAKILVAGNNFGCGSSREHAAWAILDYGFRVVISSSFGDIFYNNCLKNGLLPLVLKQKELEELFKIIEKNPKTEVTVDLERQKVSVFAEVGDSAGSAANQILLRSHKNFFRSQETLRLGVLKNFHAPHKTFEIPRSRHMHFSEHFSIDPFRKRCLLKGVDETGYILSFKKEIKKYEERYSSFAG